MSGTSGQAADRLIDTHEKLVLDRHLDDFLARALRHSCTPQHYVESIRYQISDVKEWTSPPVLEVLHGAAQRFAKVVDETSSGQFRAGIVPDGPIMPRFGGFLSEPRRQRSLPGRAT